MSVHKVKYPESYRDQISIIKPARRTKGILGRRVTETALNTSTMRSTSIEILVIQQALKLLCGGAEIYLFTK